LSEEERKQPNQARRTIQLGPFFNETTRNNIKILSNWRRGFRGDNKPLHFLVVWGFYDPHLPWQAQKHTKERFPAPEFHILDAGHFAMDLKPKKSSDLWQEFYAGNRQFHDLSIDSPPSSHVYP